jgi:hypothetical protein
MYARQSFHVAQDVESEGESSETPPTLEPQPIDVVSVKYFQRNQVRSALTNQLK